MLPENLRKAYSEYYDMARNNEILDPKTTLLIHLATALAVGCSP